MSFLFVLFLVSEFLEACMHVNAWTVSGKFKSLLSGFWVLQRQVHYASGKSWNVDVIPAFRPFVQQQQQQQIGRCGRRTCEMNVLAGGGPPRVSRSQHVARRLQVRAAASLISINCTLQRCQHPACVITPAAPPAADPPHHGIVNSGTTHTRCLPIEIIVADVYVFAHSAIEVYNRWLHSTCLRRTEPCNIRSTRNNWVKKWTC